MEIVSSEGMANPAQPPSSSSDDQRVYLVPYRWWNEAHQDSSSSGSDSDGKKNAVLFTATPVSSSYGSAMKLINTIFNSDLLFNLRREQDSSQSSENSEAGVSRRDYALVSGDMWVQALKWHSDSKSTTKLERSSSAGDINMADVYPLQLRLSVSREANALGVKINKKDNAIELFRRACKIFNVDYEVLHIWDFSGRTSLLLENKNRFSRDSPRQCDQESLLELQIYGLLDSIKCKEGKKDEALVPNGNGSSYGSSVLTNGSSSGSNSFPRTKSSASVGSSAESGPLGLTGLQNLGNTCFMNSALQCLAHTPKIVDYFLGDYNREINHDNPLGMDGEIAQAFGELIRKLWSPGATSVAPRTFKLKLAHFAPQFSGFNQHDSQELLAFLLDGLHEDLNRVKHKPYIEVKDEESRPDEEVADEYWQNHLARNDSIIVDVCQGQYRSTLVCPVCRKISVTFDPFMYLSLPLPSTTMRSMTLTVMSTDDGSLPSQVTVSVPKYGKTADLTHALSSACSLKHDETYLVAEIYNHRIIRFLEDPADSLSLIRDDDCLVVYRLPNNSENSSLAVFMHQLMEEKYISGETTIGWKAFGIPLVVKISDGLNGSDMHDLYLKLLKPFLMPSDDDRDDHNISESAAVENSEHIVMPDSCIHAEATERNGVDLPTDTEFQFYRTDEKGITKDSLIGMAELVASEPFPRQLNVIVCWEEKNTKFYDTVLLSRLPEVFKSGFLSKRPQESVLLYRCLEAFLKEEPLGPEDMWYCPGCKQHRQATKKLDLWRFPEILVIHLKRFSYSRYTKNKLETYVDFPIHDLELGPYIANQNTVSSHRYVLYAVSNHYGSLGGGHYTAFVHHCGGRWYDFDDSRVHPINEDKIKTSAAYVLFYRRITET